MISDSLAWWLVFSGIAACFLLAGMWIERCRWEDRLFTAWCWNLPVTVYGRRYRIYAEKEKTVEKER